MQQTKEEEEEERDDDVDEGKKQLPNYTHLQHILYIIIYISFNFDLYMFPCDVRSHAHGILWHFVQQAQSEQHQKQIAKHKLPAQANCEAATAAAK